MTQGFHGRDGLGVLDLPHEPRIHIPSWKISPGMHFVRKEVPLFLFQV
jgi:hypothetical protein